MEKDPLAALRFDAEDDADFNDRPEHTRFAKYLRQGRQAKGGQVLAARARARKVRMPEIGTTRESTGDI